MVQIKYNKENFKILPEIKNIEGENVESQH